MSNSQNVITSFLFHEIFYDFKVLETINLLNNEQIRKKTDDDNLLTNVENEKNIIRNEVSNAINFAQTMQKIRYDNKHKSLNLKKSDRMYLKFHKKYN